MHYNARYYDPTTGRFISADTIVPNPADPQSLNRYSYVGNNPIRYTDPSGHCRTTTGGLLYDGNCASTGTEWVVASRTALRAELMTYRALLVDEGYVIERAAGDYQYYKSPVYGPSMLDEVYNSYLVLQDTVLDQDRLLAALMGEWEPETPPSWIESQIRAKFWTITSSLVMGAVCASTGPASGAYMVAFFSAFAVRSGEFIANNGISSKTVGAVALDYLISSATLGFGGMAPLLADAGKSKIVVGVAYTAITLSSRSVMGNWVSTESDAGVFTFFVAPGGRMGL